MDFDKAQLIELVVLAGVAGWRPSLSDAVAFAKRCLPWPAFLAWVTARTSPLDRVSTETDAREDANPDTRSHLEIKRSTAVDASGRQYIVLEIVPLERVQTYHGLRVERGKPRYELNDGTPVARHDDSTYEVIDSRVRLTITH